MTLNRRDLLLTAVGAAGAAALPFGPLAARNQYSLSMATLTTGGSFYATGAGVAKVISEHAPVQISVKPFGTTGSWMPLLNQGEVELGMASTEESAWAFRGEQHYPERQKNIRLLVFGNRVQSSPLVVRRDSGIESIKDLKGKRVYWVGGNAAVQLNVQVMLESVGLSWDDVQKVPVSSTRAGADLLREGRLDATYGASATTPYAVELDHAVGLRALSFGDIDADDSTVITDEMNAKVSDLLPGGKLAIQKAGEGYHKTSAIIIGFGLQLVAADQLDEEATYLITKTLWENYEELGPIYGWLKQWTPDNMFVRDPVVPYHEGAVRFFKEAGVWDEKVEAVQSEMLATL